MSKYYLVKYINNVVHCYCKDGQWQEYRQCEHNNWQDVVVGASKEMFEIKELLTTDNQRYGFEKNDMHVRSLTQRMLYAHVKWDGTADEWEVVGKTLADGFSEACGVFGLNADYQGKGVCVLHCSDFERFEIWDAVDNFPVMTSVVEPIAEYETTNNS